MAVADDDPDAGDRENRRRGRQPGDELAPAEEDAGPDEPEAGHDAGDGLRRLEAGHRGDRGRRRADERERPITVEVTACLLLGWGIVLLAPPVHRLTEAGRSLALTAGFAFSMQALFFSRAIAPFLYFRF